MFRLTREVRLAVGGSASSDTAVQNGHAGYPSLEGGGQFLTVRITIAGQTDPVSGYVVNIKQIDQAARRKALPLLEQSISQPSQAGATCRRLFESLQSVWANLERVQIGLSPYTSWSIQATEHPMVRLSQKFEFSAAHRLHNPSLDAAANAKLFGKCNNPHGHGHNYELQVTMRGAAEGQGKMMPLHRLEQIVMNQVIERFDHKFLNIETQEFAELNPTVENIAQIIYKLLRRPLAENGGELAAVTVWETPKTWCEYSEEA
jgi:6-pyruvoyltetrahydropterin/6-carboxytetrahydropterin synthase